MKSMRFVVVTVLLSIVAAYIIAPPDPWTYSYSFRTLAIMLVVIPAYLIGRAHGRETDRSNDDKYSGRSRWLQFSLRGMLAVVTMLATYSGSTANASPTTVSEERSRSRVLRSALRVRVRRGTPWSNLFGNARQSRQICWLREVFGADYAGPNRRRDDHRLDRVDDVIPFLKHLPHLRMIYVSIYCKPCNEEERIGVQKLRRQLPDIPIDYAERNPLVG